MRAVDRRLLALLEEPVAKALRAAAGSTLCHLVGGVLRDRLLGVAGHDFDAVVAARGGEIAERLAAGLSARLVRLGGKAFAAYRLVGDGFTLDLWDRQATSLEADLARRDFTVNAFALDVVTHELVDPFDGLGDLHRRRLRATTPGVFSDDPLRTLRLVRLALQLPGFRPDPATTALAREAVPGLAGVAAERVRDEMGRILQADGFAAAFEQLAELELYPGLLLGRPGEAGDAGPARRRLRRLEPALERLRAAPSPSGRVDRAAARLAVLFAGLMPAAEPAAANALPRYREAGYLAGADAALCDRLLDCRRAPAGEAAERWFLHRWGEAWPTAAAALAALAEPPPADEAWREQVDRLSALAAALGSEVFSPPPLLDGHQIQQLLGIGPGPGVGRAAARLRRAQVEGWVRDVADAERLIRSSASDAG